jgi:hypothetical protein
VLDHTCMPEDDISPGVYASLQSLDGGMEPLA